METIIVRGWGEQNRLHMKRRLMSIHCIIYTHKISVLDSLEWIHRIRCKKYNVPTLIKIINELTIERGITILKSEPPPHTYINAGCDSHAAVHRTTQASWYFEMDPISKVTAWLNSIE